MLSEINNGLHWATDRQRILLVNVSGTAPFKKCTSVFSAFPDMSRANYGTSDHDGSELEFLESVTMPALKGIAVDTPLLFTSDTEVKYSGPTFTCCQVTQAMLKTRHNLRGKALHYSSRPCDACLTLLATTEATTVTLGSPDSNDLSQIQLAAWAARDEVA